jgi:dephospho-CoA kinase
MSFVVGLTGGIGSGKSTVSGLLGALGAGIVDADEVSRALTAAGGAAMADIERRFGSQYLTSDGALDRTRMRRLAFADAAARRDLEGILHPLVRRDTRRLIEDSTAPYVVVVVPLLLETGGYRGLAQRILVVDCEPELQIARVMKRSQLSRDEVLAIIATQVSRAERLRNADDIVTNNGGIAELEAQVRPLHERYLKLAATG